MQYCFRCFEPALRPLTVVHCALIAALLLAISGCGQQQPPGPPAQSEVSKPGAPEKISAPGLPNAYRLNEKVISGGQPDGAQAFAELRALGVKTVISVDGARPDVALARQYGLRYVHLPHGYDGIPQRRALEIAKAVRELPGPIYIHCHHGKHRSPTAATVACVSLGWLDPADAVAVLKTTGTSENYRGLYDSAQSARRVDKSMLDDLQVEFPETAQLPPLAEAMVAIEKSHDHLQTVAKTDWQPTAEHPDLDPGHEALMIKEQFAEIGRNPPSPPHSQGFAELVRDSETAAAALETAVRTPAEGQTPAAEQRTQAFERLTQGCATCHRAFRDVPLEQKQTQP